MLCTVFILNTHPINRLSKAGAALVKTISSIVIILSTGETPGEIFAANAHRSYFTLFAYFHLHHVLDKIPTWKLFTITFKEKSKAEKCPWVKKTKNSAEQDSKRVAMRCFSWGILIYCHRHSSLVSISLYLSYLSCLSYEKNSYDR